MVKEIVTRCDFDGPNCPGKYMFQCKKGHDICSLCRVELHDKIYCPICVDLENGRLEG